MKSKPLHLIRCKPENLIATLPTSIVNKLTFLAAITFSDKPLYYRVPIPEDQLPISKENLICPAVTTCYSAAGYNRDFKQYPYYAENDDIEFVLLELYNEKGEVVSLILTAWRFINSQISSDIYYDTLNIKAPYPLYNLPSITSRRGKAKYVLILCNEKSVDYIHKMHNWITQKMPCTTYLMVQGTNFKPLRGFISLIVPHESQAGYQEAYCVYNELNAYGCDAFFVLSDYPDTNNQNLESLSPTSLESAINTRVSYKYFAEIARDKYGIQPPEGLLPKAVSLNNIPKPGPKEMLLKGLLAFGHQATIVAPRGAGKSIFSLYIAICLILKIEGLNGQICPLRHYIVLIIDYELEKNDILARLYNISAKMGLTEEQIEFVKDKIRIRSAIDEKADLHLDTEEGWLNVLPDVNEAEIVIVDSLHWAFPSAMSTDVGDTDILNDRYKWCKQNCKSLIVLDHPSKTGNSPFGSIGKDIGLDAVLFMSKSKNGTVSIRMTKNRHFSDENPIWANFKLSDIIADNSPEQELSGDDVVSTDVTDELNLDSLETTDEVLPVTHHEEPGVEESILALRAQYPNDTKADFVRRLQDECIMKRSKAYESIKDLETARKITFGK